VADRVTFRGFESRPIFNKVIEIGTRAFAAAGLDEKMLRFGLIVDETIMCGIGADSSINLFSALGLFRRKAVTVERSIPRALP
jgi:hypothetical protein